MAGIIGYGAYIPRNRIKVEEIAKIWGADAPSYKRGLGLEEKSVPSPDQDTITMSVEAARNAIKRAGIDPREIGAVYVGSESHPYAVKPSRHGPGRSHRRHAGNPFRQLRIRLQGRAPRRCSCACAQVESGRIKYGLAVGADTSQGAPGDALEYSAAAGAGAFIFGRRRCLAEVNETYSFMTDTPDFWRREYQHYPRHARPLHRRAGLLQARSRRRPRHHGEGRDDAQGLHLRRLPPAQRQVPAECRQQLGFTKEQIEPGGSCPSWEHLLRVLPDGADGHPGCGQARRQDPDGLLRVGRGQRCLYFHRDRPDQGSPGQGREDPRMLDKNKDLPRLRDLRQVPRQDPEGGVRREHAMREVAVLGVGLNEKWGELWEMSLRDIFVEAALERPRRRRCGPLRFDVCGLHDAADCSWGRSTWAALMADYLGMNPVPATRVESACASGGAAFRQGFIEVASGVSDIVLVGGVEKMTDVSGDEATYALSAAADMEYEAYHGITFPGLYALMARAHMHRYGTTREQLAACGREEPQARGHEPGGAVSA